MIHNGVWFIILYNVCNIYRITCIFFSIPICVMDDKHVSLQ